MEAGSWGKVNTQSNAEEDPVEKSSLSSSPPQKQSAGSVIYKLVRVEGDGTLIPATDDEVMEVEHMLEDDKKDLPSTEVFGQTRDFVSNVALSPKTSNINSLEGLSQFENSGASPGNLNVRLEELTAFGPMGLNEDSVGRCPDSYENEQTASRTLDTHNFSSPCPDFSLLEGEICLDDLTIRELQETFRATFGFQTSAKDKLWLKRRIAMQLTRSCDFPSTDFMLKGRKIVIKNAKQGRIAEQTKYEVDPQRADQDIGSVEFKVQDLSSRPISQVHEEGSSSGKRLRASTLENDSKSEHLHMENIGAKRVRKPTRRYIEELSEIETRECCGRPITPVKSQGQSQSSAKHRFRPTHGIGSQNTSFITRMDFLGGCGVQIPYALRIRRGRPRTKFVAPMNAALIQKEIPLSDCDPVDERFGASGGYLDDYADVVLRPKCSARRKHHRAWTLHEVAKLVEGVSKYGAGRWSEIKRLVFPSYTYRTSVDLKDKWRNLLRACFTQMPTEKGALNSQKHTPVPIPTPILLRVRELAEMQAQEGIRVASSKITGHVGRDLQKVQSGFL